MKQMTRVFYESVLIFIITRLAFGLENNIIIRITKKLQPGKGFLELINQWDSVWYIGIIKHGYMLLPLTEPKGMAGQADWAFFPLLPVFAKVFCFFGFSPELSGIIVNQIAFLLCIWVFYLILLDYVTHSQALFGTFILAISPFNIFVSAAYSDTLFLLFSLLAFYNLKKKNYWLSAICGAFLSATRFFGIIYLVVYLYDAFFINRRISFGLLIQSLLISSGLLTFMAYLYLHIGDPLAFYHIQKAWGHMAVDWFSHPFDAIAITFMSGQTYAKWFFILSLLWVPYLFYRKMYEYAIFSGLCLAAPLAVGTLWSYTRYSLSLFTFYLVIALITNRSQSLRYIVLLITVILHFGFYLLWMVGDAAVL